MAIKLGIAGGGQLARMMLPTCIDWDCDIRVLDISGSVAEAFCRDFKIGDFKNPDDLVEAFKDREFVTIDLEAVSVDGLKSLEEQGVKVAPSSSVLSIIQNKIKQKNFFKKFNFPTSQFEVVEELTKDTPLGFLKLPTDGYDGKGVMKWGGDISSTPDSFRQNILWEEGIDIEKEISVIGVRGISGEIKLYDPTEMVFDHKLNLISHTLFPSSLTAEQVSIAKNLAFEVIEKLNIVGLLAVELFLTKDGRILVNELAPRPHNSGHHTIESCVTDQFENHLRAVCGLAIGSCARKYHAATLNIIGTGNGDALWSGVDQLLGFDGVYLHNYGKKQCRAGRKMGHITITGANQEEVEQKLDKIKTLVEVKGRK